MQYRYRNGINFVAVVTQINSIIEEKSWVVDSEATKHIYVNRNAFTMVWRKEKNLYMWAALKELRLLIKEQ